MQTSFASMIASMPRHEIEASIPALSIVNTDVTVMVKSNEKKLGELLISKGSIDWLPSGHEWPPYRVSWERFDEFMRKQPR